MDSVSLQAATLTAELDSFSKLTNSEISALDPEVRRNLSEIAKRLSIALEAPGDTVERIVHSPLQLPLTSVGVETKLFELLAEQDKAQTTVSELAKNTKVDEVFLKRLLRYYQSFGMVSQLDNDVYAANNVTKAMTSLGGRAGVPFYLSTLVPAFNALPTFLRESGYSNLTDSANCPWYSGHNTDEAPFTWVQTHPPQMELFMGWMQSQRDGLPMFLDVIDFQEQFARGSNDSTVFLPQLPGRIILQDQQRVIDQVKSRPLPGFTGIEAQAYDFFSPQPVKGARTYYLRNILHDWPTHKNVEILRNTQAGMSNESRLLIDEMAVPERNAPWRATQLDLAMASCFGAMERSRAEWDALLDEAGLQIPNVWKYTDQLDANDLYVIFIRGLAQLSNNPAVINSNGEEVAYVIKEAGGGDNGIQADEELFSFTYSEGEDSNIAFKL